MFFNFILIGKLSLVTENNIDGIILFFVSI